MTCRLIRDKTKQFIAQTSDSKNANDNPGLLELQPDVFVEFEPEKPVSDGRNLFLNVGLNFFVHLAPSEAAKMIQPLTEFHEQRLIYNENILAELLEFRAKVIASLNEIRQISQGEQFDN